jgi:glycosyltransferase involved in cell wall biosynthesis
MRVLHVIPSLSLAAGGPPVVAVNIARSLADAEIQAELYTTTAFQKDFRSLAVENPPMGLQSLQTRVFPIGRLGSRLAFSSELAVALAKNMRDFDLVHIHMLFQFPQFAAFRAAKTWGIPYVVSPHGALDPYLRTRGRLRKWLVDFLWQREMMEHAAAVHFTTEEERDLVQDLDLGSPAVVIPNGVGTDAFGCEPPVSVWKNLKQELHLGRGPFIVNHGRLDSKKGLPVLIRSMSIVRKTFPDAQLLLVGPDSRGHRRELEKVTKEEGLQQSVVFAGLRRDSELVSLIHAADLWALPSYTENFGYAVVEAMAAGKAVVTSPYVNIAPAAARAGAMVVVENEPALVADTITRLLAHPTERRAIGDRAKSYARQFDWAVVGRQYVDLYSDIVGNMDLGKSNEAFPVSSG